MSDAPENPVEREPARYANGRFGPGNPGRRAGSRNRISQRLVTAILADFERNREAVFQRLREDHAAAYVRLVARFLPANDAAEEPDIADQPFTDLPLELLIEALTRLEQRSFDVDRYATPESFLYLEAHRTRLAEAVRTALVAAEARRINGESTVDDDRNSGESTVAANDNWPLPTEPQTGR